MRPEAAEPGRKAGGLTSRVVLVWILPLSLRLADLAALAAGGASLSGSLATGLREAVVNWDGHWYLGIAADGYSYNPGTDSNVGFFPAFPLAMRWLGDLFEVGYVWAGLAVSLVASVLVFPLLYRLVHSRLGEKAAGGAVVAAAVFPTAFFFALPYPEALFAVCVFAAFLQGSRGRWVPAAVAAFLAGCTKPFGVLLAPSFAWTALELGRWKLSGLRRRNAWGALLVAGAAVAGFGAYAAFLQARFGRALAFYAAQMDGWPHRRSTVVEPVIRTAAELLHPVSYMRGPRPDLYWAYLLDVVVVAVSAACLLAAGKRMGGSWVLFWVGVICMPLLSGTTNSFARYQLVAFPLYAALGLTSARRVVWFPIAVTSAVSQVVLAYLFGRGWWIG